jgi:hypothetical protein
VQVETRVESVWLQLWNKKDYDLLSRVAFNRPISAYRFPRRALTLCPQLCMGV